MSSTLPALPPPPLPPWCVTKKPSEICFIGRWADTGPATTSSAGCFISFLCQPGNVFYQERQIVRYHLKATQRPHQTGPEINGGGAPWLWPPCLARLYFVKIFHQMRNISHTNQMRRRWVVSLERYVNIVLLQGFPVIMQYNFAYKSGKLIVSH